MKKIITYLLALVLILTAIPITGAAAEPKVSKDYQVEIYMEDGQGKETDLLPKAGEKATFKARISSTGDGILSDGIKLIAAAYAKDGRMIEAFRQPAVFEGKTAEVSREITVKDSYYTMKAFVWDTAENVAPLSAGMQANSEEALKNVTIEVRNQSGTVLASNKDKGGDTLIYEGAYNYESDEIVFQAPEGVQYLMIQVDEYVGTPTVHGEEKTGAANETQAREDLSYTYEPALVYAPEGEVRFIVPRPADYSDANNFSPYDPRAFTGQTHTITARVATSDEIYARRNLAVNPFDNMEQLPYDQHFNRYSFPHAIANYVTRDEKRFVPRNAIDGFELNNWHSFFPYQSWAGGDRDDLNYSVLFGRTVEIDEVQLYLRAQWADKHDTYWNSAVLEFSDGTEMQIELKQTNEMQSFKLPEKKKVSWVHLKELKRDRTTLTSPYAALTEIKVFGTDVKEEDTLPSQETIVNLAKKVNDYWINLNGANLGTYFWNNAVYHTGNMEMYYLTGDDNYYNNSMAWADTWNWTGNSNYDTPSSAYASGFHADNHIQYQTYIDLYNMQPDAEKIRIAQYVIDKQMNSKDKSMWYWVDALYMGMPVYAKLGQLTGEQKYYDWMYEMFRYSEKEIGGTGLFNEEDGLWYRDTKYIYPDGSQSQSSNGKKVYWSRGEGWAIAAMAKVLEILPDDDPHRIEYERVFKTMAASLLKLQGDDGFWRRNLGDYEELPQPETSGTVFFTYAFAWGINHGLLDRDVYMPAIIKTVNSMNAIAIHPDGRVGRVQPIGENPAPTQNIGYAVTQDFGVGGTLLMLSEVSKLEDGLYTDDLQPMLEKRMVNAVGIKVDSPYALKGTTYQGSACQIQPLCEENLTPRRADGQVYVPTAFITSYYGKEITEDIRQIDGKEYVLLERAATELGKKLFVSGDVIVIGNQEKLFLTGIEEKLITFLDKVLTEGKLPGSAKEENRFAFLYLDTLENLVKITGVSATAEPQSENSAGNVIDRKLATRWSADSGNQRTGQSVTLTFDPVKIDKVGVAPYLNKTRTTTYQVEIQKTDGTWQTVRAKADSLGQTDSFEYIDFPSVEAKAVRVTGYGNAQNTWSSFTEIEVLAAAAEEVTYVSTADWTNISLGGGNTGVQEMEFDLTILDRAPIDGVVGYSDFANPMKDWPKIPVAIQISPQGMFNVRNGSKYENQAEIKYEANTTYHFVVRVDLDNERYSVDVGTDRQNMTRIAENYKYRNTSPVPADIGNLLIRGGANAPAGQFTVQGHTIRKVTE